MWEGKGRFSTCSVLTGARFPSLLQILYILHWQLSSASYEGLFCTETGSSTKTSYSGGRWEGADTGIPLPEI